MASGMAGDGTDATLAALLSQTLQPKKTIRGRRMPVCSKHPNKFGQHQTQRRTRTERDCERLEFVLNEILSVVMTLHFSITS
jgi:hypothetical protein